LRPISKIPAGINPATAGHLLAPAPRLPTVSILHHPPNLSTPNHRPAPRRIQEPGGGRLVPIACLITLTGGGRLVPIACSITLKTLGRPAPALTKPSGSAPRSPPPACPHPVLRACPCRPGPLTRRCARLGASMECAFRPSPAPAQRAGWGRPAEFGGPARRDRDNARNRLITNVFFKNRRLEILMALGRQVCKAKNKRKLF